MRVHKRARMTPDVEALEGKTLLSATIGGLHKITTDTGATVTVERESFRARDGHITLHLQLRGGGRRFSQTYDYKVLNGAAPTDATADVMSTFLNSAQARIGGGTGGAGFDNMGNPNLSVESLSANSNGDNASYSAIVQDGAARIRQRVSIRSSTVRGVFPNSSFLASDAFNLLVQDLFHPRGQNASSAAGAVSLSSFAAQDRGFVASNVVATRGESGLGATSGVPFHYGQGSFGGGLGYGPNPGLGTLSSSEIMLAHQFPTVAGATVGGVLGTGATGGTGTGTSTNGGGIGTGVGGATGTTGGGLGSGTLGGGLGTGTGIISSPIGQTGGIGGTGPSGTGATGGIITGPSGNLGSGTGGTGTGAGSGANPVTNSGGGVIAGPGGATTGTGSSVATSGPGTTTNTGTSSTGAITPGPVSNFYGPLPLNTSGTASSTGSTGGQVA